MSQNAIVKKVVHPGVVEVSLMRQMECGLSCSSCEGCPQRRKEEILALARERGIPAVAALGRKGGSTVAAALCNALLYQSGGREKL